jgi:hypothetical protein
MEDDTFEDLLTTAGFTTRKKMMFRHMRRSDGRLIELERRMKDVAVLEDQRNRQTSQDLAEIKDNTGWLSKWMAGVFKSGAGEAEKKYPSRKR